MEFQKYFEKQVDTDRSYKCKIHVKKLEEDVEHEEECGHIVNVGKDSYFNLRRHVMRKHDEVVRKHQEDRTKRQEREREQQTKGQSTGIKSFFATAKTPLVTGIRKKQLDTAFFKMIYLDFKPLTEGEREGTRHFASEAQPGYTPPCYNTVRDTLMPAALQEMEGGLRDLLKKGDGFVVSADIWTSRRGHSFLAIVATFIDGSFRGHTSLLSCDSIKGHHTAERIYQIYESVLKYWNIQGRVIRVVTDSASNMVKAFNIWPVTEEETTTDGDEGTAGASSGSAECDEEDDMPALSQIEVDEVTANAENMINTYFTASSLHLRCPIHLLQLAIKDAIGEHSNITRLLAKVGNLVRSVRKSTLNTEEADRIGVRPTTACTTRWSSQLHMIDSVLRLFQKDPLWQSKMKTSAAHLTLNEVRQLTQLVGVLTPLAELTNRLQKELGNLGMILPAVSELKSLLTKDAALPMTIAAFSETLANNITARYSGYYTDKHILLASVLDPRFKTEWIVRDEHVCHRLGEIRDLLVEETERMSAPLAAPNPTGASSEDPESEPKRARLFGSYFSEQLRTPEDVKGEVEKFLSTPRQNPDTEVIQFWKENSKLYPRLVKVARVVFSIPSGSASVERVFSAAGLVSRSHRTSLKPKILSQLVLLKVNAKELSR